MVIRVRRRLIAAATALAERGVVPPGVDAPEVYAVRAGGCFCLATRTGSPGPRSCAKALSTIPSST